MSNEPDQEPLPPEEKKSDEDSQTPTPRGPLLSQRRQHQPQSILDQTNVKMNQIWDWWVNFVEMNQSQLNLAESTLRYSSYLIPGRFTHNVVIGELIYASSSVLNTLTQRANGELSNPSFYVGKETRTVRNLKTLVTIIQHLQLFIEWASIRNLNPQQRWKVILAIEVFKAAVSLYLLYYYKGHMLIRPDQSELEAIKTLKKTAEGETTKFSDLATMYLDKGRGPHPHGEFAEGGNTHVHGAFVHSHLMPASKSKVFAEMMHLLRPVVYVVLRLAVGLDDSKILPFAVSLILDLSSVFLHSASGPSLRQKMELKRRCYAWFWYLFRPPLFQRLIEQPLDAKCTDLKEREASMRFMVLNFFAGCIKQHQSLHFNCSSSDI